MTRRTRRTLRKALSTAALALAGATSHLAIFVGVVGACIVVTGKAIADPTYSAPHVGPRLIQEEVRIPVRGGAYMVAATILRPDGEGPFGAVVLNHGVPGSERERLKESAAADFNAAAPVFARRGYVVVMPMRRGFGATGGEFAEDAGPCRNPDYMRAEAAAAQDVMAAYEYARTLPYVDGSRMLLAGQSAGGIVSMFAAAMYQPKGLQAVLAFAAGRGGNPDLRPGTPCAVEAVARVFDAMGPKIRVPVLMHYAENDKYFGPATTKLWHERFVKAGARAHYVMQPAFGRDGHYLFGDIVGVRWWLPTVERFLGENKVAFDRLDSPSQPLFAKLPVEQSDSCRALYRAFLEAPAPRAYAVSTDGRCGFAGAMADATGVALTECKSAAGSNCALYAVDSEVVWKSDERPAKMLAGQPKSSASTGSR